MPSFTAIFNIPIIDIAAQAEQLPHLWSIYELLQKVIV